MILSNKDDILDRVLRSYEGYFDIEKCNEQDIPLVAKCQFHVHNKKYVLIKKATLWEADANEYVYIFKVDNLTKDIFNKCKNYAYDYGMRLIEPKPGHMYSYITTIFICDSCEKEAEKLITKCNLYKSFKFSFYGWMDFHTACIDVNDNKIFGNKASKNTTKFLKDLLIKKSSTLHKKNKEYC